MKWYPNQKSRLMKKLAISFIFFCIIGLSGFSQTIDFSSKIDSIKNGDHYQYTISITLNKNFDNCSISLFELTPEQNFKLLDRKINVRNLINTFTVNDRQKWMIMVESGKQSKSKFIK